MTDSTDLTTREKFHVDLFKDPKALFRKTLIRKGGILALSLAFMISWIVGHDPVCAYVGYGMLFFQIVQSLVHAKRGIERSSKIYTKIDAKLQEKQGD